ncbi:sulfotransferase family cytosolic 1B member 1-like isoform X2 [Pecten maximus]|nr:sulfotransferase family cytosolic 1B member 1-like isoform X2 [Pecten maximus]XP_033751893.1 sulfotransferase family cytosolic 1B member 1-like isoform X2 [Pecten maximus]XP_033751895.1 sulfotransferase family cytosolic 1B member 1-like isoform X2 [Pecten maximus]
MSSKGEHCTVLPEYDGYVLPDFLPLLPLPDKQMAAVRDFESKDSDILICSLPKTGTNWCYEILSMLVQGHATYVKGAKIAGMLEAVDDLSTLNDLKSPRILSTHVPFRHLPKQHLAKGCKIILSRRNPKDVFVSWYNHCKHDDRISHPKLADEEEFPGTWDCFLKDQTENKHNFYDGFFPYEKAWDEAIRTKQVTNVHTIFYEELKKDPVDAIKRLAKYLELPENDELAKEIADKCSFQKFLNAVVTIKAGPVKIVEGGNHFLFRKGIVGDWKNWFTVAQNEKFNELLDKELKGTSLKYTYEI